MGGFFIGKFCKNNNEELVLSLIHKIDPNFTTLRNIQIHTFYKQYFQFYFNLLNSNTLTNLFHRPTTIACNSNDESIHSEPIKVNIF